MDRNKNIKKLNALFIIISFKIIPRRNMIEQKKISIEMNTQ